MVKFRVENHGADSDAVKDNGNHESLEVPVKQIDGVYFAKHWESTSYVGLHYMYVSVWSGSKNVIPEVRYAVYVGLGI